MGYTDFMSKETLNTALRYLQILNLLSRRQSWGTQAIQQVLEELGFQVSLRTVQRDLRALQKLFPALKSFGPRTHLTWRWSESAPVMDIPGWDLSMAVAMQMAHIHLHSLLPPQVLQDLKPYFDKADAMLSASQSHLKRWSQKVAVASRAMPLQAPDIDENVLIQVYAALLNEYPLEMVYQNRQGEAIEAIFSPAGLVVQEQVLYLVGCFWTYDDIRHIALHRIKTVAKASNASYHIPQGFDLHQYLKTEKAFSYPVSDNQLHLRLRMDRHTAKHLAESPLSDDQQVLHLSEDPDHVILTATVSDTQQLRWWLLGLGAAVEVLAPQSLRQEMKQIIEAMHSRYRN